MKKVIQADFLAVSGLKNCVANPNLADRIFVMAEQNYTASRFYPAGAD